MSGAPPTSRPGSSKTALSRVSLLCRCPRCGEGMLFSGLLTLRDMCPVCGLDFSAMDTGDGAAVAVTLLLGAIVVGAAFIVEFTFSPPLWVHVVLWPVVTIPLAVAMMRPLKAALVAQQFRHRASELGL